MPSMTHAALQDKLNYLINDHFAKLTEKTGGAKYFPKEYISLELLNNYDLVMAFYKTLKEFHTPTKALKKKK